MTKRKKHYKTKVKTRIVYRERKEIKPIIDSGKLKSEILELEERKRKIGANIEKEKQGKKGFARFGVGLRGVVARKQINDQIRLKQQTINRPLQLSNIKQRVEIEKAKTELADMRRKNMVTFESLGGTSSPQKKQVRFDELF